MTCIGAPSSGTGTITKECRNLACVICSRRSFSVSTILVASCSCLSSDSSFGTSADFCRCLFLAIVLNGGNSVKAKEEEEEEEKEELDAESDDDRDGNGSET